MSDQPTEPSRRLWPLGVHTTHEQTAARQRAVSEAFAAARRDVPRHAHLTLAELAGDCTRVELDGADLTADTLGLTLTAAAGQATTLTLELQLRQVEVDGKTQIAIHPATAELLQSVGWRPPRAPRLPAGHPLADTPHRPARPDELRPEPTETQSKPSHEAVDAFTCSCGWTVDPFTAPEWAAEKMQISHIDPENATAEKHRTGDHEDCDTVTCAVAKKAFDDQDDDQDDEPNSCEPVPPLADPDAPCAHHDFDATVNVGRIGEGDSTDGLPTWYSAEITVKCANCGEPFRWVGFRAGLSARAAMVSVDETELRAPMRPASSDPDFGLGIPGFAVTALDSAGGSEAARA